ncbi:MAG: hypothetical protein R2854_28375 [Caldilineaceae bacterium]
MIPEQEQAKPYQIDWFVDQLVRSGLYADPQSVWRSSLRALFEACPKRSDTCSPVPTNADVSLGKAAELMGVSQEEMEGDPARIRRTFILALRALRSYFADADNA